MARSRRFDDDDWDDDEVDDGFDDDDEEELVERRRRRRRRNQGDDAVGFIVPQNVSAFAIIGLYAGLIGFCVPVFGSPFAIVAFVCSIIALVRWKKSDNYGGDTSNTRAIIGMILSGLGILINLFFLVAYIKSRM